MTYRAFGLDYELKFASIERVRLTGQRTQIMSVCGVLMVLKKVAAVYHGFMIPTGIYDQCGLCEKPVALEEHSERALEICGSFKVPLCWIPETFVCFPNFLGEIVHDGCWKRFLELGGDLMVKLMEKSAVKYSHFLDEPLTIFLTSWLKHLKPHMTILEHLEWLMPIDRLLTIKQIYSRYWFKLFDFINAIKINLDAGVIKKNKDVASLIWINAENWLKFCIKVNDHMLRLRITDEFYECDTKVKDYIKVKQTRERRITYSMPEEWINLPDEKTALERTIDGKDYSPGQNWSKKTAEDIAKAMQDGGGSFVFEVDEEEEKKAAKAIKK